MATVLDALVVTLGLDAEKYKKGIDKVHDQTTEAFKEMGKSVLEFFGIMAAAAGVVEFVKGQLEAEVAAGRLAKTLDVDVESLEALEGAVKMVGGSSEATDQSLKQLNMELNMIAIHGPRSKMALTVFAGLGISEVALKGKDAIGVLGLLADKMQGMSEAKAMGLGARLGIDEGTIRLLTKGREGMKALTDEQLRLGVASAEQGEQAERLEQDSLRMKASFAAAGREILAVFMPALIGLGHALAALGAWAKEHPAILKAALIAVGSAFVFVGISALVAGAQAALAWILALGPINLIIGAIALVAAGIYLVMTHLKEVGHFFNQVAYDIAFQLLKGFFTIEHAGAHMWNALKTSAMAPLEWIWNKIKAIADLYASQFKFFSALLHGDLKGAVNVVKGAVNDVTSIAGLQPAFAGMAQHPAAASHNNTSSTRNTQMSIGQIQVVTQATDAAGIAKELPGAIRSNSLVDQFDGGMT